MAMRFPTPSVGKNFKRKARPSSNFKHEKQGRAVPTRAPGLKRGSWLELMDGMKLEMPDGQKFEVVDGKLFELVEVEVDRKTHLPPPMEICPLMRVYMALEHMRLFGLEELSTLATFQEQCRLVWKEFLSLSEDDRTSKLFLG